MAKGCLVLLQDLVAYDEHTIDSYDFDKRLRAMTLLSKNSWNHIRANHRVCKASYIRIKSMHDDDFRCGRQPVV